MTTPIVPSITDGQLAELESSYEHAYCTIPGSLIAALVLRLRAAEADAARYRWLIRQSWFQSAFDRFDPDDGGIQARFEREADRIISASMEQSK